MKHTVFYVMVYLLFSGAIVQAQSLDQKKQNLKKSMKLVGFQKLNLKSQKSFYPNQRKQLKKKKKNNHLH